MLVDGGGTGVLERVENLGNVGVDGWWAVFCLFLRVVFC